MESTYLYPTTTQFFHLSNNNPESTLKFSFPVFDLSRATTDGRAFMGAFIQTQRECEWMKVNVSIPSIKTYEPFSGLVPMKSGVGSQMRNELILPQLQESFQYYFEQAPEQSLQLIDRLEKMEEEEEEEIPLFDASKITIVPEQNYSILSNYESLFAPVHHYYKEYPQWQATASKPLPWSAMHTHYYPRNIQSLASIEAQAHSKDEIRYTISDQYLLTQVSKMLQGVESMTFRLDYVEMRWHMNSLHCRYEHMFKSSVPNQLASALEIASLRSKIDVFLEYVRVRAVRKVLVEVASVVREVLLTLDEIVLDQGSSLVELIVKLDPIREELQIVYNLLFQKEVRQFSFFDHSFLNSEYVIFQTLITMAKAYYCIHHDDSATSFPTPIIHRLFSSVFKPITFLLNHLIFQDRETLDPTDQLYLKYYFNNPSQLLQNFAHKINLIKHENTELYIICKIRGKVELKSKLQDLKGYRLRWERVFTKKHKLIEKIKLKHRAKLQEEQQWRQEEKLKSITEIKEKYYSQMSEIESKKKIEILKNREQLRRVLQEIKEKEENRKLMALLEREREKGYLLEREFKEKMDLMKIREKYMQKQLPPISGPKLDEIEAIYIEPLSLQKFISSKEEIQVQHPAYSGRGLDKQQGDAGSAGSAGKINQSAVLTSSEPTRKNNEKTEHTNNEKTEHTKEVPTPASLQLIQEKQENVYQVYNFFNGAAQLMQEEEEEIRYENEIPHESLDNQIDTPLNNQLNNPPHCYSTVNPSTVLQICIDSILTSQREIIEQSMSFLVFQKYHYAELIEFMHRVFMSGDGILMQQLITVAISPESIIDLNHFNECLLFDGFDDSVRRLQPSFYIMKSSFYRQVNVITGNIEEEIGFQFKKLPCILEQYFSYIHLSKYMQIFSFIIRVRHCQDMVSRAWKSLNEIKRGMLKKDEFNVFFVRKLYRTRHVIQTFLALYLNYLFYRVIEKEYGVFNQPTPMSDMRLEGLGRRHQTMLDNIIKYGYIDGNISGVAREFRKLLLIAREFKSIVDSYILDNILQDMQEQVLNKVQFIEQSFKRNQQFLERISSEK